MKTIGLLLDKEIVPRIQVFANKETLPEMPLVERMIEELDPVQMGAAPDRPPVADELEMGRLAVGEGGAQLPALFVIVVEVR